jgi:type VI secretion system protein ImpG
MLALWLMNHLRGVSVRGLSAGARGVELGRGAVRPSGFDGRQRHAPVAEARAPGVPPAAGVLHPAAEVPLLRREGPRRSPCPAPKTASRSCSSSSARRPCPPASARTSSSSTARPVINLFACDADPIKVDPLQHEYLLRASEIDPGTWRSTPSTGSRASRPGRTDRREYRPFFDFLHAMAPEDFPAYYRTRRSRSPLDDGIDTWLSVQTPRDVPGSVVEETLSIEVTCTNRGMPSQLRVGDISVPAPGSPPFARFKNITPVTVPVRPPFGQSLHWRLISHLALNYRALADAESLRAILDLYNFQALIDRQAARANRLRIEGIRDGLDAPRGAAGEGRARAGRRHHPRARRGQLQRRRRPLPLRVRPRRGARGARGHQHLLRAQREGHPSQAEYSWKAKSGQQPIL